jgi:hypothetical protein
MKFHGPRASSFSRSSFRVFRKLFPHSVSRPRRFALGALLAAGAVCSISPVVKASGTLAFSPASVDFGSVPLETSSTVALTLKNSGTSSITFSKVTVSSTQFALIGLTVPSTLAAGASKTVTVRFVPTAAAITGGTLDFYSNASNSTAALSLIGTGIRSALDATPAWVWVSAPVGASVSQPVELRNSGAANVTISAVSVPSGGFSVTGLSLPLTLGPNKTAMFNVVFSPKSAGTVGGTALLTNTSATLGLSVTGAATSAARTISASTAQLNFGNVTVGKTASLSVTLASGGNSSVTISGVSTSGAGVSESGLADGTTLSSGQATTFSVAFAPKSAGSITGSVTVASNAQDSPTTVAVTGTGVAAATSSTAYSVALKWTASASSGVTGYDVYRSTVSGGPYTEITSAVSATEYTDDSVQAGTDYFYVVTSVSSTGARSGYSSQIEAQIP